jgi:LacI family transcriptional regulator
MATDGLRIAIGIDVIWPYKRHTGIVAGILAYGRMRGWRCELVPFLETSGVEGFRGRSYDGVIARTTPALAAYARRAGLPLVNVWMDSPVRDVPAVLPDVTEAGRMAARHLLVRGHRRLGYLGYRGSRNAVVESSAFRTEALRAGAACDVHLVTWTDFPDGTAWRRFTRDLAGWIRAWKPPVGILVTDDVPGRYLAGACLRQRLRIPGDVAIVTLGNTELLCEKMSPSLSSIEMGFERVGRESARLLDRLMAGRPAPARSIAVPPTGLVARLSTNAFAVDDPLVSRALRLIAGGACRGMRVRDVVTALPTTGRSLERRFRRILKRTVIDEITRVRLERAKRLLAETDAPLKTIADRCGFSRPEILAKVFRRVEGAPPGSFRRERRPG